MSQVYRSVWGFVSAKKPRRWPTNHGLLWHGHPKTWRTRL